MYTVVVADDEFELRRAIIEMLDWKAIGFEVVGEAENGVEALDLVEKLEPDLLLTDIKMPFITGIDLARRVREVRPSMQIAFLSGYDDFQYAQQAIQYNIIKYLLKPISREQLHLELQDIKRVMDERQKLFISPSYQDNVQLRIEQFLMSLLLDNDAVANHFENVKDDYNRLAVDLHLSRLDEEKTCYIAIVSRILNAQGELITGPTHVGALDTITKKHVNCGSFYSQGKIVSLLVGMEWEIEKYINIITNEIIQTTKRVMNQDCYIGVGNLCHELNQAHVSYSEACNAIVYGIGANQNLSFIKDFERKDTLPFEYIELVSIDLERMMKSNQTQEIINYIEDIFCKTSVLVDLDLLMMHIISRTCTLVRALCDDSAVKQFLIKASVVSSLLSKHNAEEKKKDISEFCILCKDVINKQNRLNGEVICDELIELINQQYGEEDFSLSMASDHLFISASYLSALLKRITGESFVILLTKKRMEVAKEKVVYSTSKILEIAKQCGYSDQHYFSYCFKRQFGISPNKMREQLAHEKN